MAAIPAVALPALFGPAGVIGPVALLAASILLDAGTYSYVLRHRGLHFALAYTAVAFTENVAIASGVLTGAVQWLTSPAFRALYERPDEPDPAARPGGAMPLAELPSPGGQQ
jgi:hypothetical protein